MCGICGAVNINNHKPVKKEEITAMTSIIIHRGPDEDGYYLNGHVGFGMRRLSIIDLVTGHQPIHNKDKSIWLVLNGEIYNYKQLREMLTQKGHRFYSLSDTEVIVHLYEEFGLDCFEKLNGMFTIAIWDENIDRLILARDRLGIKPLYYVLDNNRIIFASEMKSILQFPEIKRELDFESLDRLFTYGYVPAPRTIIRKIKKLMPGHLLIATKRNIQIKRYWSLLLNEGNIGSENDCIDKIRYLLRESVRMRLISDVPLGAFLSGGIDSSSVVATMGLLCDRPVKTFSIGFEEEEYSELKYARLVASRFGTDHHELIVKPDIAKLLPKLVSHFDEPFFDSSAVPTYYVSQLARNYVKVALSGDGGDELFAGYNRYVDRNFDKLLFKMPEKLRKKIFGKLANVIPVTYRGGNYVRYIQKTPEERYFEKISVFNNEMKKELYSNDPKEALTSQNAYEILSLYFKNLGSDHKFISKLQYIDIHTYLPDDILTKVDRVSMAVSLEARVPLLDHNLVEFVATIPSNFKLRGNIRKYIFKKAMENVLPKEILYRKKTGFGVPIKIWLRKELKGFVHDILFDRKIKKRGYFNYEYINKVFKDYVNGYKDYSRQVWSSLWFELWHRRYVD